MVQGNYMNQFPLILIQFFELTLIKQNNDPKWLEMQLLRI